MPNSVLVDDREAAAAAATAAAVRPAARRGVQTTRQGAAIRTVSCLATRAFVLSCPAM